MTDNTPPGGPGWVPSGPSFGDSSTLSEATTHDDSKMLDDSWRFPSALSPVGEAPSDDHGNNNGGYSNYSLPPAASQPQEEGLTSQRAMTTAAPSSSNSSLPPSGILTEPGSATNMPESSVPLQGQAPAQQALQVSSRTAGAGPPAPIQTTSNGANLKQAADTQQQTQAKPKQPHVHFAENTEDSRGRKPHHVHFAGDEPKHHHSRSRSPPPPPEREARESYAHTSASEQARPHVHFVDDEPKNLTRCSHQPPPTKEENLLVQFADTSEGSRGCKPQHVHFIDDEPKRRHSHSRSPPPPPEREARESHVHSSGAESARPHVHFVNDEPKNLTRSSHHTQPPPIVQPRPPPNNHVTAPTPRAQFHTPTDYMIKNAADELIYDVLIVGGGVVGLAVLRAATLAGYRAVVVEAEPDLLPAASSGNSGIACTGVDAAPGTLERALIRDSISQLRPFLKKHHVPFRACGSLVCEWEWDRDNGGSTRRSSNQYASPLGRVLAESLDAGDTNARKLQPQELGNLEPNISPLSTGAVHIPGEIVLDPWLYSIALVAHARENGAKVYSNFEYDPEASFFDPNVRLWKAVRRTDRDHLLEAHPPPHILAKSIVNATGIMADVVQAKQKQVNPPHWNAAPRRGQYRVFMADKYTYIEHPIQPVPTQRTKGIFLYSTLYNHIVVGPTAQEQSSRFDRSIDNDVANELTSVALRILPDLDPQQQHVGEYVGIRPATAEYRDYQITTTAATNWIVAAGIRSTGLTASLGIGRHVVNLLQSLLGLPRPLSPVRTTPLPELSEMVGFFHNNKDGNVLIHGYIYRVTHPLTRMGFAMRSGIAADQQQQQQQPLPPRQQEKFRPRHY